VSSQNNPPNPFVREKGMAGRAWVQRIIRLNRLTPNDPYGSYRTANLQKLHFIYLFNK